jgi:hypothetical protein
MSVVSHFSNDEVGATFHVIDQEKTLHMGILIGALYNRGCRSRVQQPGRDLSIPSLSEHFPADSLLALTLFLVLPRIRLDEFILERHDS